MHARSVGRSRAGHTLAKSPHRKRRQHPIYAHGYRREPRGSPTWVRRPARTHVGMATGENPRGYGDGGENQRGRPTRNPRGYDDSYPRVLSRCCWRARRSPSKELRCVASAAAGLSAERAGEAEGVTRVLRRKSAFCTALSLVAPSAFFRTVGARHDLCRSRAEDGTASRGGGDHSSGSVMDIPARADSRGTAVADASRIPSRAGCRGTAGRRSCRACRS